MGLFDFFTGTKRPDKNVAPAPRSEVSFGTAYAFNEKLEFGQVL